MDARKLRVHFSCRSSRVERWPSLHELRVFILTARSVLHTVVVMRHNGRRTGKDWLDTGELDLSTRFDVFVKYQYGRAFLAGALTDSHRNAYADHIHASEAALDDRTLGTGERLGAAESMRRFQGLLRSVARDGFDEAHAVPVDPALKPLDGAHRVAACMAADRPLCVAHRDSVLGFDRSYRHYRDRGMRPEYMDLGATALLSRFSDLRAAVIFGAAMDRKQRVIEELNAAGPLLYEKAIRLSGIGNSNLIRLIHDGEGWLGERHGYLGARGEAMPCFPSASPSSVSIVLFRPSRPDSDLARLEERICEQVGIAAHCIHVSDTWEEAGRIASYALSQGGLHLLDNRRYGSFAGFERDFAAFQETRAASGIDREHVLVVGSSILSIYGIRDARDLDVLVAPSLAEAARSRGLDPCNAQWERYGFDVRELVYDPSKHFFHDGHKCVRLEELIRWKKRRGEAKDHIDLSLIEAILGTQPGSRARVGLLRLRLRLYSNLTRLRSRLARWLVRLGLRAQRRKESSRYDVETNVRF